MYDPPPAPSPTPTKPTVSPPRVVEPPPKPAVNTYQPKPKQRYKVGTCVQVPEVVRGKNIMFVEHITDYDARTGLYIIRLQDGKEDEFDDSDVEAFWVKPGWPKKKPQANSLLMRLYPQTNPLAIAGFFPKASTTASRFYYGNNARAIFDEELHKWMSYKDLIKHPNPKICARWNKSGINEFARLAQGLGDTEGMDVVSFIQQNQVPGDKKSNVHMICC
mmetsp:Transcript_15959/g.32886  ORF Transcript_15959/g.32886 Transcript_15959/m.32886 type:complete len:219 (-) Transcript_15959:282-938(-)